MTTLPGLAALALLTLAAASPAFAETTVTKAETLVVITPNAPVIVPQGSQSTPTAAPGATAPTTAPGAAATAAPQNEDWNNVSHINGTPVKVGERTQYLYKLKKTNLSGNPFGLFFGVYDIAASYALSQHVAASVSLTTYHDDGFTAFQAAATLPLYFRRTYSGPFLEGGLLFRSYDNECYDYCGDDNNSWAGPQMLFGWHWTFDSGLNLALAFGVMKRMTNTNEYGDNTEPNGYFRVGYAF